LIHPDSDLYLEESKDPFTKSQHGHLSDLKIYINRNENILSEKVLFYFSKKPVIDNNRQFNFMTL